jgi:hypothetical protein
VLTFAATDVRDFLLRLNALLPRVHAWVERTNAEHAAQAIPVIDAGFSRLSQYFPESVLRETRVARVKKVPFPPFSRTAGLPELANLEQMPISAITFTDTIFVHPDVATEGTHAHELCHAIQVRTLGLDDYFLSYVIGAVQHGYARNPLEISAYDLQSLFDREVPVTDAVAAIRADALRARAWAAEFFRQHGVPMGG